MAKTIKAKSARLKALNKLNNLKPFLHQNTFQSIKNKLERGRLDTIASYSNLLDTLAVSKIEPNAKLSTKKAIEVARKTRASKVILSNYKTRDVARMLRKVDTFNYDSKPVTLKNMTPYKVRALLRSLDTTQRIVLTAGDKHYPLTPEKVKDLSDKVDSLWVEELQTYDTNYDSELLLAIKKLDEVTLARPKWMGKNRLEGAFCKSYHNTKFDLDKFGVYRDKQEQYNENCFVQSLIVHQVDDKIVKAVKKSICGSHVPYTQIKKIAEKYNLYIRVKDPDTMQSHKDTRNFGNKENREILIGMIDKHYFAIVPVDFTMYSLKHYHELVHLPDFNQIINAEKKKNKSRYTNSYDAIKYMHEHKDLYLRAIPHDHLLDTQYHEDAGEITNLHYDDRSIKPNIKPADSCKSADEVLVYFDFETITNTDHHKPYLVCNSLTGAEYGEHCGKRMLYALCKATNNKNITLIAHNAGYDFRFIQQYLVPMNEMSRGHTLLSYTGRFFYGAGQSIRVRIKDSYSVISMKLEKFGEAFDLTVEKQIMPYSMYIEDNIEKRFLTLDECKPYCDAQVRSNNLHRMVTEADYETFFNLFTDNCKKWNIVADKKINIVEYSRYYCQMDVDVLKQGYEKFATMLQDSCEMDITEFVSAAQLANTYMLKHDVFEDVMQLSSVPREYVMKAMVGGRTMCANNEMRHVKGCIDDFDAVSLYPSAMSRLGGYLKGTPKVLENKTYGFLRKQDGYFVQIKVLKVGKTYPFPLMSYINSKGIRVWTNNPKSNLYVCKTQLEDLIKFHKIEFEVVDGYYYNEGRNTCLKEVIEYVFNERKNLQKCGNPLEIIYKLIMNSAYGKTMQKPIDEDIKFVREGDFDNFIDKYYNSINPYYWLYGRNEGYNVARVPLQKGVNEHFNNAHCGVEVLAMSKRIMNEVMCLASDMNINIYYQDTDSMHIDRAKVENLAENYKKVYGRELIGDWLGQFHTDFKSKILKGDIYAVECIFLGKKCYIDKLRGDEEGVYDYHVRCKGVPEQSILYKAKVEGRTLMDIYKSLLNKYPETFDLCCGGDKIRFNFMANYTITTKYEFPRTLQFRDFEEEEVEESPELVAVTAPNAYIYMWHSNDCNEIYVGSTVNMKERKDYHYRCCTTPDCDGYNRWLYLAMRAHGGFYNWQMTLLDAFESKSKRDTEIREQEWKDKLNASLNMCDPVRKKKEKPVLADVE